MREEVEKVLEQLLQTFGADIFKSPNRFRGAILDHHIEKDEKKIRFLLNVAICEMKVYTRLLSVSIDKLIKEMHNDYEINKKAAIDIIGSIAALHSLKLDIKSYEEEKEHKPERVVLDTPPVAPKVAPVHPSDVAVYVDEHHHHTHHTPPHHDAHHANAHPHHDIKKKVVVDTDHKVGDRILFGQYKWRILRINSDGSALLISQDIISKMAYHNRRVNITWEKSDIRKYLNTNFYEKFNNHEQKCILTTQVDNPFNDKYFTQGGSQTIDKIFLLSIYQVKKYFKTDMDRIAKIEGETDWWWLRSPGRYPDHSAFVYRGGNISMDGEVSVTTYMNRAGMRFVNYKVGGVRPAMVVALNKI